MGRTVGGYRGKGVEGIWWNREIEIERESYTLGSLLFQIHFNLYISSIYDGDKIDCGILS